ncbi:MAG TPA: RNA polymerase sigma factor [Thermoanaerobaculia bacterium]|nr:RNA polymerase sigma factor [Thermoanaerobaculia bacterium]
MPLPDLKATPSVLTDEDVVRRVIDGETALFEIVMRRYNQRIYRVVRAIVRNDDDAEDVMQQAYVNAYEHLRQFAGGAKFSTWLTRIAINEALARVRKRGLHAVDENEMMEIESNEPDPERLAAASELREVVESEIALLPDAYRTVLMLREVEGLSTSETAECLGVNDDVIKTRLHRARSILRDNLYRRAGLTFEGVFPFGNARCDRVVANVFTRIGR